VWGVRLGWSVWNYDYRMADEVGGRVGESLMVHVILGVWWQVMFWIDHDAMQTYYYFQCPRSRLSLA